MLMLMRLHCPAHVACPLYMLSAHQLAGMGCSKLQFEVESQGVVLKAGSCGMLNGMVVGSGCGGVCGDRFPRFCL